MNKLILKGLRNIPVMETPEANKDYLITLIGSLEGKYTPETFDDSEQNEITYYLKIERVESIVDIAENKPVKIEEKGKKTYTPSQKLRFAITSNIGDSDYDGFMKFLMGRIDGLIEDYKDKQNV